MIPRWLQWQCNLQFLQMEKKTRLWYEHGIFHAFHTLESTYFGSFLNTEIEYESVCFVFVLKSNCRIFLWIQGPLNLLGVLVALLAKTEISTALAPHLCRPPAARRTHPVQIMDVTEIL